MIQKRIMGSQGGHAPPPFVPFLDHFCQFQPFMQMITLDPSTQCLYLLPIYRVSLFQRYWQSLICSTLAPLNLYCHVLRFGLQWGCRWLIRFKPHFFSSCLESFDWKQEAANLDYRHSPAELQGLTNNLGCISASCTKYSLWILAYCWLQTVKFLTYYN